jgi:hypothetical protein
MSDIMWSEPLHRNGIDKIKFRLSIDKKIEDKPKVNFSVSVFFESSLETAENEIAYVSDHFH